MNFKFQSFEMTPCGLVYEQQQSGGTWLSPFPEQFKEPRMTRPQD